MEKTQQQILRHHGGDGDFARKMITQSYERRHDVPFWEFWNEQVATAIQPNDVLMDWAPESGSLSMIWLCVIRKTVCWGLKLPSICWWLECSCRKTGVSCAVI